MIQVYEEGACTRCPASGTLVTLAKFDTPPEAT